MFVTDFITHLGIGIMLGSKLYNENGISFQLSVSHWAG